MSFIWPPMLLLLVLIPVGTALVLAVERRRRGRLAAHGLGATGNSVTVGADPLRRRVVAALALLVVALARPQGTVSLPRVEGTVVLAFDVSGSMAADDLAPTRMEAAKVAARAFVEGQPASILIGIVAFSDSGFSTQVPTADRAEVASAIERLSPGRGTSLSRGIETALTTIEQAAAEPEDGFYSNRSPGPTAIPTPMPDGTYAPAVIVLLSDGENTQGPDPLAIAEAARDRGVRIHTVGIGSTAGTTIEVEGFMVHSRLDEAMLQAISTLTKGDYFAADDPTELREIYEDIDTRLVVRPQPMEVTSIVTAAGAILLLIGGLASLRWLGRLP